MANRTPLGGSRTNKQTYSTKHLPVKRSINLAEAGDRGLNWGKALPLILVIVLLAAVLSKFAVIDRISAAARAQSYADSLRAQVEQSHREIEGYGDLSERYAHYTYAGMTPEELSRCDRSEVVMLIERVVMPRASVDSWSVNGNLLNINLTGDSLQEVNLIAQRLEDDEMVSFCTVTAATTNDSDTSRGAVRSNVIVYLNAADQPGAQEEVPMP